VLAQPDVKMPCIPRHFHARFGQTAQDSNTERARMRMMVGMDQMDGPARALGDAADAALPAWVEAAVAKRLGRAGGPDAEAAGQRARAEIGPRLRALLAQDVDDQRSNPLAILREAVRYPTEVLQAAGALPVERDDFARERFPDDDYDLTPATFADFGPEVFEAGIAWGAAKAWIHKQRHAS
jgi:hypothetical protein